MSTITPLSGLTIVLPCLDEAENLPDVVRYATAAAERCAATHEIVIVDDGSRDRTGEVAARLVARDPRVRLIFHTANHGYGQALRTGIEAARQPWVLLVDADLQLDLEELAAFLPLAPSHDLVVGRRINPQGAPSARARSAVWSRFVRAAFRLPVHDVDCAFRLVRRELLDELALRSSGPAIGTELVVKARAVGARIAEVPVHHRIRVAGRNDGEGAGFSLRTARELAAVVRAGHDMRAHA